MIRLLVTSATYRQSSQARPELSARDSDNRLLARQNRFRVESEILRDSALAVSAGLNLTIGGPSFRPPMPADVKWLGTAGAWTWSDDAGPVLNRRSLYIYAQRTVPHPLLPTFDQANNSETCTRRERSDTPLQALTLLNNATFVEAARELAKRARQERPDDGPGQVERAFRLGLGREPTRGERRRLQELWARAQASSPDPLFVVAQTVLNLDEFQNRE